MDAKKTRIITLTARVPVRIVEADWPIVAVAKAHDGQVECQANRTWSIRVRQHADGRRIVYGMLLRGPGGMPINWQGWAGGELVEAKNGAPDDDATVRAIRRCAPAVDAYSERWVNLASECIADLPAKDLE